jgi:hypothetical protein
MTIPSEFNSDLTNSFQPDSRFLFIVYSVDDLAAKAAKGKEGESQEK